MTNRATSSQVARTGVLRRVVDELGDWAAGPGPLYRALALALSRAVERGALVPGARLPAERPLARALSVSRGTAVAAYDQLVADGLLERREGSGTYVIGAGPLGLPAGREGSALVARLVDRSATASEVLDLSISVLRGAEGLPEVAVTTDDLASVAPDTGYSPWGLPGLRRRLAEVVTGWGLPTAAEQVVVTTGAQQAIAAAAACWVRPGDPVVVEAPTYPGAVAALVAAGARLVPVAVDRDGVVPEALARALRERPVLAYLQPTLHSPTGSVLAERRRAEVAALLSEARVPLVEDHALAALAWGPAPPPVAAWCPEHPVALVGSMSKQFWGGLRVGFVRAPEPVALRMARVKATQDLGTSAVGQLLAERLLDHPEGPAFVARRNARLRHRYDVLAGALAAALPSWTWTVPDGGLSIWVRLPRPLAGPLAQVALRHGVAVATGEALGPLGDHPDGLRISFAAPAAELRVGVARLAAAWAEVG